jgi:hypothetical protein
LLVNVCYGPEAHSSWLTTETVLESFRLILDEKCLNRGTFVNMAYVISNLAANSLSMRDRLIHHPLFEVFLRKLPKFAVIDSLKDLSWVLKILLRGERVEPLTHPPLEIAKSMINILAVIFKGTLDPLAILESSTGMSCFLRAGSDDQERIEFLLQQDILPHIGKCLFEFTMPSKATLPLLQILEVFAGSSEHIAIKVFSEVGFIEVRIVIM